MLFGIRPSGIRSTLNSVKYYYRKDMNSFDEAKKLAAYKAVDDYVENNLKVGIGSGSTVVFAVERLAEKVRENNLNITCIPSSFQARQLIVKNNLRLAELEMYPELDVCIDGADEVDSDLNLIKGGGGCLLQEKILASCAKKLIIVADYMKQSTFLGEKYKKGIPLEVVPMSYIPVKHKIEKQFGGAAVLRLAERKVGPLITDNGNFILDWRDFKETRDWSTINIGLSMIPGIVETGLFIQMAEKAYFGLEDGTVREQVVHRDEAHF